MKVLLHVRCSDLGFVKRLPEMCLVARPLNAHNRRSRAFFDWFVDGALPKDGPSLRWWCSFRNDGRPSPPQCSHPAVRGWSFGDSSHSRSGFVDIRARAGENAKVRFQKPRKRMGSRKRNRRGLSRKPTSKDRALLKTNTLADGSTPAIAAATPTQGRRLQPPDRTCNLLEENSEDVSCKAR